MRFRAYIHPPPSPGARMPLPEGGGGQVSNAEVEVPTRTVAGIVASLGGVTAIAAAIVNVLAFACTAAPAARQSRRTEQEHAQVALLTSALRDTDPNQRRQMIGLLLDAGLLDDPNGALRKRVLDSRAVIPRWVSPTELSGSPLPGGTPGPTAH